MKKESLNECSVFFLWTKESFWLQNRPSRNSSIFVFFTAERNPVLKFNQGSEVFKDFSGTFLTLYGQENYVFQREFMDV